jgi:putative DNA primase/helicase
MTLNVGTGAQVIVLDEQRPPHFSDEALALRFAERHAGVLRYVAAWGKWLMWKNGQRWCFDDTLNVYDRARHICREAASQANELRIQMAVASAKTVAAVERLARTDRRLAATTDQWDADPWALNTPSGIVDLRTGAVRPARPEDYCTKTTAVAPDGQCPLWKSFLWRITGGSEELIDYLQRILGYSLTGITREHALFFAYGTGANGKSVLISTVAGILAEYHTTAPIETFTASNSDRHPTDLARLRGARLVTASETEEGRPWAEAKIKALTGGDRIAARFMRQDFFEFTPIFKLLIAGNHTPSLRSVDEAIRRRLHLIPFSVTIPIEERDPLLSEKLREEWPGILGWMIEGCRKWQATGLQVPDIVRSATKSYLDKEDAVGSWIDDCCDRDPQSTETSAALWASWLAWARREGEPEGSRKSFSQKLESKGFLSGRTNRGRFFRGLRIR